MRWGGWGRGEGGDGDDDGGGDSDGGTPQANPTLPKKVGRDNISRKGTPHSDLVIIFYDSILEAAP